jgi:hypothetical protein
MWNLVDAYFAHINMIHPVLHRPTFVKSIQDDLHHRDEAFGGLLLLVCAIGSRVADDNRVLVDDGCGDSSWHSAGWTWFTQVRLTQKSLLSQSRLYDLQLYCVSKTGCDAILSYKLSDCTIAGGYLLAGHESYALRVEYPWYRYQACTGHRRPQKDGLQR